MTTPIQEPVNGDDYYNNAVYYKTVEKDKNKTKENFTKACQLGHPKALNEIDTFFNDFITTEANTSCNAAGGAGRLSSHGELSAATNVAGGGASAQPISFGNFCLEYHNKRMTIEVLIINFGSLDFNTKTALMDDFIFNNNYYGIQQKDIIKLMRNYYVEFGTFTVDFKQKFNDFLENNNTYETNATLTRFLDLMFEFCKLYRPTFECDVEIREYVRMSKHPLYQPSVDTSLNDGGKYMHMCCGCFSIIKDFAKNVCGCGRALMPWRHSDVEEIPRRFKVAGINESIGGGNIYNAQTKWPIITGILGGVKLFLKDDLNVLYGKILILRKECLGKLRARNLMWHFLPRDVIHILEDEFGEYYDGVKDFYRCICDRGVVCCPRSQTIAIRPRIINDLKY